VVTNVSPVAFPPVTAQWNHCSTIQEGDDAGSVLAVGVATAILRVLQNPSGLAPQVANTQQAITTGGFVVTVQINLHGFPQITMQVLLPSAVSGADARRQAYVELLQLIKDTVEYHWVGFTRRIDEPNVASWPAWAQAVRGEWIRT
jgi:hypothetical protein